VIVYIVKCELLNELPCPETGSSKDTTDVDVCVCVWALLNAKF
jgi:hypothetical protein